ncbi:SpoIIE family protein phosphatase [Dethiothermospora halolimnae]|uniref:PP2C family protein-serine/threonine phosphatase n=1 Tax=Dethiothermospora halolimnae TaxID=3114390 RepID=UPI003CCB93CF
MLNEKAILEGKIKNHARLNFDILDGMVDWVRVIDNSGVVIYANQPMKEALGNDIIGRRCYRVLGKCKACDRCITQTTISTGIISEKEEHIGDRIFAVKSSPVKDLEGNNYAAVEVFRDVTKERKLEKELKKKNKKMNKDLSFARTLQKRVLPKKGVYDNIEVDYMYKPCEMLSGDIFDIFHIDDNHIGFYIADVVGHGVTASMMTMFVKQTMKVIKKDTLSPSETLEKLHKEFLDLKLEYDKYFTIFYGVLDKRDNTLKYVNGGHNSIPILFNKNKVELLETRGYPISYLFDSVSYDEKIAKLNKNDKLLFYTDGIIECRNRDNEQFGIERLLDIVKKDDGDIIDNIKSYVDEFIYGEHDDDLAIFTIEVKE